MSNQVLLTVSGVIPPDLAAQVASGRRPRPDYQILAQAMGADLLDVTAARHSAGWFGLLLERLGGVALLLAWVCFLRRKRYRLIFTDGEQVGLPLALLLKYASGSPSMRPQHVMIVHVISVAKKMFFLDRLAVHSHIDTFLVYASAQKQFIEQRWGVPAERVVLTPFMVDTSFFNPEAATPRALERPQICAVGLERRDYPTLLQAVTGLPVDVVIAAASPWSRRSDSTSGHAIPANVRVQKFSQYELRQLYADSAFLVMPLAEVDFQAGVTAILEALAMERAVICSRTPGQTDVIVEAQHGLYVPPGDAAALRAAIERLLADPELSVRLGRQGRRLMNERMSLDCYVEALAQHVRRQLGSDHALPPQQASEQVH